MDKPCAPACEKNREPILDVLRDHFAARLPHLIWQTSDRIENLPGIQAWLDETGLPNTPPALALDVTGAWPAGRYDAVFSANTLHIMPWSVVERFFAGLADVLADQAKVAIYGPFNYGGRFTSESNAAFDLRLKENAPHQGIRDCLVWHKTGADQGVAVRHS